MSKFLHGFVHAVLIVGQVANVALPFIPPPYNAIVAAALGAGQAAFALANHDKVTASSTGGTPVGAK